MSASKRAASAKSERHRRILDRVIEAGFVSAADLSEFTGMSLMTVHRDLEELSSRGLVRRIHGGVSALPTSVFESSSEVRLQRNVEAKRSLATIARELVEPGMSIMLDDSTTVFTLAQELAETSPLTVVTNYLRVIELFKDSPDVQLIAIGGQYSRSHESFIGTAAQTGLTSYAVDVVFQSISTMSGTMTYHQEQDIVLMKREMLLLGTRRVLMVDGSKIGRTSLHRFVPISEFTDVIITDDVDPDVIEAIADVTRVHIAPL